MVQHLECHDLFLSRLCSVPYHVIIGTTMQLSEPGHVSIQPWQNPSTHLSINPHLISIHLHLILLTSSSQHHIIRSKTNENHLACISSKTTPCEATTASSSVLSHHRLLTSSSRDHKIVRDCIIMGEVLSRKQMTHHSCTLYNIITPWHFTPHWHFTTTC